MCLERSFNNNINSVPKLNSDDIHVGALLGSGAFASVYQVFPRLDKDKVIIHGNSCTTNLFALKRLEERTESNHRMIKNHTNDFINEVKILSQLPLHQNIIQLYGISSDFDNNPMNGFLVLQYLPETLDNRMKSWKKDRKSQRKTGSIKGRLFHKVWGNQQEKFAQHSRVSQVCVGVAKALSFLHQNGIIYRDIKASNIGFDEHGNVRLFDFNLARSIANQDMDRKLTACVGTLRYMAPEVALGHDYDFSADVHSFAILMYEICTLDKAFPVARNIDDLFQTVFLGSCRPSLRAVQSDSMKKLLKACWDPNPECRPLFPSILIELHNFQAHNLTTTKVKKQFIGNERKYARGFHKNNEGKNSCSDLTNEVDIVEC